MSVEIITDEEGFTLKLQRLKNGLLIPVSFIASGTERMHETPLRPDDVLLLSYPKAGCHWLWENLRFLLNGKITKDAIEKDKYMMDQFEFGHLDDSPSPRILNNHAYFDQQPRDLHKGEAKVIFLYRNPKDVAVSYYYHVSKSAFSNYNGKFSSYLKLFVEGKVPYNYFEYMRTWEKAIKAHPEIPILLVRYEDLHRKPIAERKRIVDFLGIQCDDTFLNEVSEATTIENMRINKHSTFISKDGFTPVMYRQGKIGDWKNHFTVSMNEMFDEQIKTKLGDSDLFKFIYE